MEICYHDFCYLCGQLEKVMQIKDVEGRGVSFRGSILILLCSNQSTNDAHASIISDSERTCLRFYPRSQSTCVTAGYATLDTNALN